MAYDGGIAAGSSSAATGGVLAATGFNAGLVFAVGVILIATGVACTIFRFATRRHRLNLLD